jgi:hypothetical protein
MDVCPIPLNVALDFCLPEWGIGFWDMAASGAAVPEAPVDKNCDSLSWKNEVGTTRQA